MKYFLTEFFYSVVESDSRVSGFYRSNLDLMQSFDKDISEGTYALLSTVFFRIK